MMMMMTITIIIIILIMVMIIMMLMMTMTTMNSFGKYFQNFTIGPINFAMRLQIRIKDNVCLLYISVHVKVGERRGGVRLGLPSKPASCNGHTVVQLDYKSYRWWNDFTVVVR